MRICSQCVLPETFPGSSSNTDGVCSLCRKFVHKKDQLAAVKEKYGQAEKPAKAP
jgi:hypothetical protein